MAKILLVIEDYQELVRLEAFLRKLGFDVSGVSNEYSLSEQFISFHPDILVASGRQGKVSPLSVAQKAVKARNFSGKIVLCFYEGHRPRPSELVGIRMDAMVEAPIQEARLVDVLGRMTGVSAEQLLQKLTRTIRPEEEDAAAAGPKSGDENAGEIGEQIFVRSNAEQDSEKGATMPRSVQAMNQEKAQSSKQKLPRVTDYSQLFVGEELPPCTTTDKAAVKAKWAEVRGTDDPELLAEKKRFVRALFKKND